VVAAAALAFYLLATGRWAALVGGSWLMWLIYQFFPNAVYLPFPDQREPVFAMAAWQVLFYSGLALGYHRDRLGVVTRALEHPVATIALAAVTIGLIVLSQMSQAGQIGSLGIPGLTDEKWAELFRKPSLGPGRVLAFALVGLFARQIATFLWAPIERALGWLLIPLGQKALFAYGFHLFLLGPFYLVFATAMWVEPASPILNGLIQVLLVGTVWGAIRLRVDSRLGAILDLVRRPSRRADAVGVNAGQRVTARPLQK
jgi:hypothetical protein